ncbi:RNA polymerase sigma factor [Actinoallomurus rhizosphaericola]|uniref:RNA polymerase sigma factor n=1 Tax=Actinoallomurus rhizosphaericola TaxID=2952536 RepID=UPI002090A9DC|nr:RNA polymerase sigma factor [Actinoallomurus rhizosphaericola]MCO5993608.1 RNA polymerase sigma factor [Actinoallomurus rhizosphaericola]
MTAAHGVAASQDEDAAVIGRSWHEPDQFKVIYDRYFPQIYRYVAGRLGRDVADDVAAETFLTAFRKRDRFDPERGAVRPWLFGIATNLVGQYRRDESRRYAALARLGGETAGGEHEERVAARVTAEGVRPSLARALAALPEGDRDVLLLVALGGLGYEEAAQALEIPGGTVGSRLSRARKKLREALGGTDPTSTEEEFHG